MKTDKELEELEAEHWDKDGLEILSALCIEIISLKGKLKDARE